MLSDHELDQGTKGDILVSGNDELHGGTQHDNLYGGDGNDILNGGDGIDDLYGGAGSDVFVLDSADGYSDNIHDFNLGENDVLDMGELLDNMMSNIGDYLQFDDSNGTDTVISVDRDGSGTTNGWEQVATLHDVTGLDMQTMYTNGNIV